MTEGDLIYCYTCGEISYDISKPPSFRNPKTRPCASRQDSRFNPHWNYDCGHCHGFKTINASQFLDEGRDTVTIKLMISDNREMLKAKGRELKALGIIKNFWVRPGKKGTFTLYEWRKVKKDILKAIKNCNEKESFK